MRIALQHLLHLHRQAVEPAPHVRQAARQPHPRLCRQPDHRPSTRSTRPSAASSTDASTRTCTPPSSISIVPAALPANPGVTVTGTRRACGAARDSRRQHGNWWHTPALAPSAPPSPGAGFLLNDQPSPTIAIQILSKPISLSSCARQLLVNAHTSLTREYRPKDGLRVAAPGGLRRPELVAAANVADDAAWSSANRLRASASPPRRRPAGPGSCCRR